MPRRSGWISVKLKKNIDIKFIEILQFNGLKQCRLFERDVGMGCNDLGQAREDALQVG